MVACPIPNDGGRPHLTLVTPFQTLQDVQELQGQVQAISQTVGMLGRLLNVDFSIVECQTAQNAYSSIMGSLEGAWQSYAGFTVNGEDVTDATTILPLLQSYLQLIPQRAYLSPSNWNDVAAIIDQWANSVLTGQALFNEVIEFGQFLLGAGQYDDSAIVTCAQAAFNKWQTAGAVSPYDDRQYYGSISAWLLGLITLQVQSGFILQQANLWMCVRGGNSPPVPT